MRILFPIVVATALITSSASADHHEKKAGSYGSHSSYGSGTDGHKMNHGNMEHGDRQMTTMPADGAILDHSPKMIGVDFGHAMTVESITVSTLTGEMIKLDVSGIDESSHIMVKAPELQPDDYIVAWRAKGLEDHVMSGSFAFTVE